MRNYPYVGNTPPPPIIESPGARYFREKAEIERNKQKFAKRVIDVVIFGSIGIIILMRLIGRA